MGAREEPPQEDNDDDTPQLVFKTQLAQGSPTGVISGFKNVKELYLKIAECFAIDRSDILFCTLNTHRVDMNHLLGGAIGLEDFIFAHCRGRAKEIEITKSENALGLTITDNGAGYSFIKRIKEGSVMSTIPYVEVRLGSSINYKIGDHIEKIDGVNLVGSRHFEVAKALKEIPKGSTFVIRLVEPQKAGFVNIGPRTGAGGGKKAGYGTGKQTLRLKSNGTAAVEEEAEGKTNTMELAEAIDDSDLEAFGFTDDFIFELWGAITDAKSGRGKPGSENDHF